MGGDVVDENGGESSSDESLDHGGVNGAGAGAGAGAGNGGSVGKKGTNGHGHKSKMQIVSSHPSEFSSIVCAHIFGFSDGFLLG